MNKVFETLYLAFEVNLLLEALILPNFSSKLYDRFIGLSVARNIFQNYGHLTSKFRKFRPFLAKFRAFSGSFFAQNVIFLTPLTFLLHFYVTIFQKSKKKKCEKSLGNILK